MILYPLFPIINQFQVKNGALNVGGYLRVYYAGRTDVLAPTFSDSDGEAQNPEWIILDNNARAKVYVDCSYAYNLYVYDFNKNLLWTQYDMFPEGIAEVNVYGREEVIHDGTLSGRGTEESPLGVIKQTSIYYELNDDGLITGIGPDEDSVSGLYATEAAHAAFAGHANSADHANTATNAINAQHADSADSANTAVNAIHATTASDAAHADEATHAVNADHATNSDSATNASHATNADNATNADYATNAGHATNSDSATNASHATNADNATNATSSVSATYATYDSDKNKISTTYVKNNAFGWYTDEYGTRLITVSGNEIDAKWSKYADDANYATEAGHAANADHATYADYIGSISVIHDKTLLGNGSSTSPLGANEYWVPIKNDLGAITLTARSDSQHSDNYVSVNPQNSGHENEAHVRTFTRYPDDTWSWQELDGADGGAIQINWGSGEEKDANITNSLFIGRGNIWYSSGAPGGDNYGVVWDLNGARQIADVANWKADQINDEINNHILPGMVSLIDNKANKSDFGWYTDDYGTRLTAVSGNEINAKWSEFAKKDNNGLIIDTSYQKKLTAGANITIDENNVISSTGGVTVGTITV